MKLQLSGKYINKYGPCTDAVLPNANQYPFKKMDNFKAF
jgi:hypothetical protein